jgi:DNA modification methylase
MILNTDAISGMQSLDEKSVNCVVTSPPYFGLRAYGTSPHSWPEVRYSIMGFPVVVQPMQCELGQEPDHFAFIGHLILIFREAHRVLRDDGTCWVNLGDSYAGGGNGGVKPKDLIGIPWMFAYAMRDDGWYLRQDIIWSKPNPMPESVTDRCTKSHEYIFMFSKSERYYYDAAAIRTESKNPQDDLRRLNASKIGDKSNPDIQKNGLRPKDKQRGHLRRHAGFNARWDQMTVEEQRSMGANKRSVWNIATKPFKEAHFATFPPELVVDPIKAGCPAGGTVLDPFFGSGTTGIVAAKLGRKYIGIELNPVSTRMARIRLHKELGLFV